MEIAQYPQYLIPQVTWRERMCTEEMLGAMDDFCLLRRCDCEEGKGIKMEFVEDGGSPFLTHEALSDQRIGNMSMSLLGTLFQKDDIKFKQRGDAMADWTGGEVDANRLIENWVEEVPQPWFVVVWFARGLHDKKVPYKKGGITNDKYEQFKADVEAVRNIVLGTLDEYNAASEPLFGITKINHRPSNLNYWHFTLDTYPATRAGYIEEPMDNSEKNLLKKVGKQLLRYSFRRYEEVTIPVVKETLWNK